MTDLLRDSKPVHGTAPSSTALRANDLCLVPRATLERIEARNQRMVSLLIDLRRFLLTPPSDQARLTRQTRLIQRITDLAA